MKKEKYFIYRYFDKQNTVIYVGLTSRPLSQRVKEHSVEKLQSETYRIDFSPVKTAADMRMYELFYINKYTPKYNTRDLYVDNNTVDLPELTFQPYLDKSHPFTDYIETDPESRKYRFETKGGHSLVTLADPFAKHHDNVTLSVTGEITFSKKSLQAYIEELQMAMDDLDE